MNKFCRAQLNHGLSPFLMRRFAKVFMLVSLIGLCMWGGSALAVTCTSTVAGGAWNATSTWTGCAGGNGTPANTPGTADTAIIATSGAGAVAVNVVVRVNALTVNPGATLNVSTLQLRVNTTTSVSGAINFTGAVDAQHRFSDAVTINAGGAWTDTSSSTFNFRAGGITNNGGTFTGGTGVYEIRSTAQSIGGTSPISIPSLLATTTITNNGNLTVGTALTGTTLINSATGILNLGGTAALTTLTATAAGNTINYTGAAQTVKATAYSNLGLSGSGAKTLTAGTSIGGNLTISNTGGITLASNVTVTGGVTGTVTLNSTCPTDYTLTYNGGATVAHSCPPTPSVTSINRASADPTTAASVSWTVTFGTGVTGVTSSNFALVNSGLGGLPAITSVTGGGTTWTVTASTGTGTGTLGLDMTSTTGVSPAPTNLPFTGQVYSVRPATPVAYYHDTTNGVNIGFDGTTNVVSGTNVTIPPIITASLITANTCTGNARSNNHPTGLYTHSRWYLTTNYAVDTNIGANPSGRAFLRGQTATNTVVVSLYDYNPVTGAKALIGSSPVITLTGAGTTTAYPYTISSSLYTVPAGHRLMLQYAFNQPTATNNARVYCSAANAYISVTETAAPMVVDPATSTVVASPTSVAADNVSLATITVTLKDSANTPVAGKTVTLAAGSGSSTITTVSGVTDASGVATFTVKDGTIEGPITYTATDTTDAIVITQTAQVTFTTTLCFTDDFNRATLLGTSNWTRTKSSGTTYDADIVGNRLRLTDATGNRATAVHLNRLFPGAGNKVVAEFDYFSYNGTGADGVAMTLSDASIAPVAGAFGGSLGYAQKSNPGSDCTVVGGCPGFAGGWIGVGLDEYGNYSAPTEGRVDGPGVLADAVTIRGSGSGQSGYNYHTRAAAAGLDSAGSATPAPGHRYRVTVDHSDGVHAYTSVDRDTTGLGTSYSNIIPVYDAKAIPTQAAVPANWYFSFTGSTGASANIHEIDNFTVCTAQPIVTPVLHHVRIIHDGSALTCAPETITLRACANAACNALYTGSVTVDLTAPGAAWSLDPVTFSGGQVQLTLTRVTTGTVTLGGTVTAPGSMSAVCYNGSTSGDCALTYSSNACAFDTVEAGKTPNTPIFTKLAGTAFTVDVLALTAGVINTGYTGTVTVDLVDDTGVAAGSCGTTSLAGPTTPASPYTFTGANAGRRTFTFNYPNATKDVRVRMVSGATTACSSDDFAIRPTSFSVTSPDANNTGSTGLPKIKAGVAFGLDAASVNNYSGTALINNNRIAAHAGAVQTGTLSGAFLPATLASSWVSKGTGFTYSEVGSFQFTPWGVYDDGSFADVDRSKATPECVTDNKLGTAVDPTNPNVLDGNGKYGCYFGGTTSSPYFGRFTPDHFALTPGAVTPGCSGSFTYFGQDGVATAFTLIAQNATNGLTQNYTGSFAKLALTNWNNFGFTSDAPAGSTPSASATAPSGTWGAGTTSSLTATHIIGRPTALPAAPGTSSVTISAAPVDTDGVTMTATAVAPATPLYFGRLWLGNAYGSDKLDLVIPFESQYWNGSAFVKNTNDSCTALASGNIALGNQQGGLTAYTGPITGSTAISGAGSITLTKPSSAAAGSVDILANLGSSGSNCAGLSGGTSAGLSHLSGKWCGSSYDRDPTARATFGIYGSSLKKGPIYIRESY